jgi:hypothetical protein
MLLEREDRPFHVGDMDKDTNSPVDAIDRRPPEGNKPPQTHVPGVGGWPGHSEPRLHPAPMGRHRGDDRRGLSVREATWWADPDAGRPGAPGCPYYYSVAPIFERFSGLHR